MSPRLSEKNQPPPQKETRIYVADTKINPLDQLSIPKLITSKTAPLKVSQIVGPLVIPATEISNPEETKIEKVWKQKTKKTFWQQVTHGVTTAFKIIMPTWLLLWLGGFAANRAITSVGLRTQAPVASNLAPNTLEAAKLNTTSGVSSSIAQAQYIRESLKSGTISPASAKNLLNLDLSQQAMLKRLEPTLKLMRQYSPQLASWFESKATRGEVVFVDSSFTFGNERYSDYRRWNQQLTIYPDFFDLNDGQKISVLRHERSHAEETIPEYVSNSLQPSVFVGATIRAGSMFIAGSAGTISQYLDSNSATSNWLQQISIKFANVDQSTSFATQLRYNNNRSELQAMRSELNSAQDLGVEMAADQNTIDFVSSQSRPQQPWQELIGFSAVAAFGLAKMARSRKPKQHTADSFRVASKLASES